jgi:uncharacterized protein YecT (DUF1311 family)
VFALLVLAIAAITAIAARADDLDGSCAQVKKASSVVICSDNELRQQAIARNKLFEAAREKLGPEAYKMLADDQSQWVKTYTARCGIGLDDPVPSLPIPQNIIKCYRLESRYRTAYLEARLRVSTQPLPPSSPQGAPLSPKPLPSGPEPATPPANDNLSLAAAAWYECLYQAADALAGQPEFARTVVEAAFGSCSEQENAFKATVPQSAWGLIDQAKTNTVGPRVLARVMAVRAAREKLRKPDQTSPAPAIDYNRM